MRCHSSSNLLSLVALNNISSFATPPTSVLSFIGCLPLSLLPAICPVSDKLSEPSFLIVSKKFYVSLSDSDFWRFWIKGSWHVIPVFPAGLHDQCHCLHESTRLRGRLLDQSPFAYVIGFFPDSLRDARVTVRKFLPWLYTVVYTWSLSYTDFSLLNYYTPAVERYTYIRVKNFSCCTPRMLCHQSINVKFQFCNYFKNMKGHYTLFPNLHNDQKHRLK